MGSLTVTVCPDGLVALRWGAGGRRAGSPASERVLDRAQAWLAAYFQHRPLPALPPLAAEGTAFQRAVWARLCAIPYGQVATYGAIAAELGKPGGARAVGQANGRNPIPIMVPCHRVVAGGGALGGFSAGLARKRWLLKHEGAAQAVG